MSIILVLNQELVVFLFDNHACTLYVQLWCKQTTYHSKCAAPYASGIKYSIFYFTRSRFMRNMVWMFPLSSFWSARGKPISTIAPKSNLIFYTRYKLVFCTAIPIKWVFIGHTVTYIFNVIYPHIFSVLNRLQIVITCKKITCGSRDLD